MSRIKWSPFLDPFEDMDKMFTGLLPLSKGGFVPKLDMYHDKNHVVVEMGLQKIDPKDVHISVENGVLTVQGKTSHKSEVDEKNYYRKEMSSGSFYRSIPLPPHLDASKVDATFEDGVLKITIPKMPQEKTKAVEIKVKKLQSQK